MRLRNPWTTLAALATSSVLLACGGSASETPEPVRPDAWQLKQRQQTRAELPAQATTEDSPRLPVRELHDTPAKSTWGGGKRLPAAPAAPANTSSAAPSEPPSELPLK